MKRLRRALGLMMALIVACSLLSVPTSAANGHRYGVSSAADHNAAVNAKAYELQQKYGISISYPTYQSGGGSVAGIYTQTLDTLDTALSYVTPYLVQQVSSYYQETTGRQLQFNYVYKNMAGTMSSEVTVGGFDDATGLIELYIPTSGTGAALVTGDAPMTVVHEFGHALHLMLEKKYGLSGLRSQWEGYNSGYSYNSSYFSSNPSNTTFTSGYAATSFYEDFAETFAHGFVCNRAGLGLNYRLTKDGASTGLGNKLASVESLLTTYFPNATQAQENFRRAYTAPATISYQGLTLYGDYLQFAGYAEARYMPGTNMNMFAVSEGDYRWVSEIGGWVGTDSSGMSVLLFPDRDYATVNRVLS